MLKNCSKASNNFWSPTKMVATIEQELKYSYVIGESLFDFFSLYARFLVSYVIALFFVFFGFAFFVGTSVSIPKETKLMFLGLSFLLLFVSYLFHSAEIVRKKIEKLIILLGNVFGFLFNFIYFVVKIGADYGYHPMFGGAEKFVFFVGKGGLNLIEEMYAFVGGMIFIISLTMIVGYGLSLKDKFKKEGKTIKAFLSIVLAIGVGFGLFLFILFFQNTFKFVIYFIAGSMLFIYATNLFKKYSIFLKF